MLIVNETYSTPQQAVDIEIRLEIRTEFLQYRDYICKELLSIVERVSRH